MPMSEKQRRAAFAELSRRKSGGGGKGKNFEGMDEKDLTTFAHSPLHKKRKKSVDDETSADQASALKRPNS